jgi:polyisoprenyl-teichoic acid--peptidoglycan teichoic acid transferase
MIKRSVALLALIATVCVAVPLLGGSSAGKPPAVVVGRAHHTFNPEQGKIFILVIGNDAREGNPDASRADAMHLVGINTKTMEAGILNFPRDCWVNVPGHGEMKMNESLYAGGPDLLIDTMESVTGIKIDYWVMTGFMGFRRIVRDLHGVKVNVPYDIVDPLGSGANLKAGPQMLQPDTALAFNRARKTLPNGDIDRSTNQGRFLVALARQLQGDVTRSPAALFNWFRIGRKWTRFDIPQDELFRLGVLATQVDLKDVHAQTVPVSIGAVGLASVVFISPSAGSVYKTFRKTGTLHP